MLDNLNSKFFFRFYKLLLCIYEIHKTLVIKIYIYIRSQKHLTLVFIYCYNLVFIIFHLINRVCILKDKYLRNIIKIIKFI